MPSSANAGPASSHTAAHIKRDETTIEWISFLACYTKKGSISFSEKKKQKTLSVSVHAAPKAKVFWFFF
jgi:hypothetical protein